MNQKISVTIPSNILTTNLYLNEIYPDCDLNDISVTLNVTQIQQLLTLLEPLAARALSVFVPGPPPPTVTAYDVP